MWKENLVKHEKVSKYYGNHCNIYEVIIKKISDACVNQKMVKKFNLLERSTVITETFI